MIINNKHYLRKKYKKNLKKNLERADILQHTPAYLVHLVISSKTSGLPIGYIHQCSNLIGKYLFEEYKYILLHNKYS